jgi:citrate lyase subunit beta/citryl-CoA lyase
MMNAARTWLFVPGDHPDRFDRAWTAGADRVIVDLEDGVVPQHKDEARTAIAAWLTPERPVFVRVNGAESPWFVADLAAVCRPGLHGIMLPRSEDRGVIRQVARALAALPDAVIVPLIETASGVSRARRLASASPRVERLAFGSLDLALDLAMAPSSDEVELLPIRVALVLASRVAGVQPPIDGVTVDIKDTTQLRAASAAARRVGFEGKLAVHPTQIPIIHSMFAPSQDEVAWAQRVVAAFDTASTGVVSVDGMMVDRPVVERARHIVRGASDGSRSPRDGETNG